MLYLEPKLRNQENEEQQIDNGFIYPILNMIITIFNYLNFIELLKMPVIKWLKIKYTNILSKEALDLKIKKVANFIIDSFVITKFSFVLFVWNYMVDNIYVVCIVWYLLIMNVFSYFYHHIWKKQAILNEKCTIHHTRRKFLTLCISLFYTIVSYAYLYNIPYKKCFEINPDMNYRNFLLYSISNSFSGSYDKIKPITQFGDGLKLSQTVITFIFITIILARSIPEKK